eukprot:symbB.v1.2.036680.t1/scaffold5223.1/size29660/5
MLVKEQRPALEHTSMTSMYQKALQTVGRRKRKQCQSASGMPELASEIFVVRGGLPMDPSTTLQDINAWTGATMFPSRTVH